MALYPELLQFTLHALFLFFQCFWFLSDSENARDILLTASDIGLFNGEYAILTIDLLLKHDHGLEAYEHSTRENDLSHEGKYIMVTAR